MTESANGEGRKEVALAFLCAFAAALGTGIANVIGQKAVDAWEKRARRLRKRRKKSG